MKKAWKSFNIRMPDELIPIYDFLQNELNYFLSDNQLRELINNVDFTQHKGNIWRELRDVLKPRISQWEIHNKTWHSYILFENIRREVQSKQEALIIWEELVKNKNIINETLYIGIHKRGCYPTRGQITNILRSGKPPELATSATFNLDYSISEKQFFRMESNNICRIKINKKDWIDYEIVIPSSIDHKFTGRIAKPRFVKRKSDNIYVGICSYEYSIEEPEGKNILGIDIGKIKLFSGVVLNENGTFSNEYINSKRLSKTQENIDRLYHEKKILYNKISSYENLGLSDRDKYLVWKDLYLSITNKITRTKKNQAQLLANEVVNLARTKNCREIHIEDLRWLNSQGGKWNHSEIHSKIEEKSKMYDIMTKRVSAYNSSKEHPITREIGEVQNRNIVFKHEKIDRDLLAAINIAVRGSNIKIKQNLPKGSPTSKRVKHISNKKEIKNKISKIKKGNFQIVTFLMSVSNETIVNLEAHPFNRVLSCNSLLCKNYKKLQL